MMLFYFRKRKRQGKERRKRKRQGKERRKRKRERGLARLEQRGQTTKTRSHVLLSRAPL
jgi:hypothetical protein